MVPQPLEFRTQTGSEMSGGGTRGTGWGLTTELRLEGTRRVDVRSDAGASDGPGTWFGGAPWEGTEDGIYHGDVAELSLDWRALQHSVASPSCLCRSAIVVSFMEIVAWSW